MLIAFSFSSRALLALLLLALGIVSQYLVKVLNFSEVLGKLLTVFLDVQPTEVLAAIALLLYITIFPLAQLLFRGSCSISPCSLGILPSSRTLPQLSLGGRPFGSDGSHVHVTT